MTIEPSAVRGEIPYVFCADNEGVVRNVELAVGDSETLVHLIKESDLLREVVDDGATGE